MPQPAIAAAVAAAAAAAAAARCSSKYGNPQPLEETAPGWRSHSWGVS